MLAGDGILVQQPDPSHLTLSLHGDDGDESLVTVSLKEVQAISEKEPAGSASGSAGGSSTSAGTSSHAGTGSQTVVKRKSGTRKRVATSEPTPPPPKRATKAEIYDRKKRKKREATAAAKGKPLKPARQQVNKRWAPELKNQVLEVYNSQFAAAGKGFTACATYLANLAPSFNGIKHANIQGWILVAQKLAVQEPNEFGLVVTTAGRPPELPREVYEELKEQIKALAKTNSSP